MAGWPTDRSGVAVQTGMLPQPIPDQAMLIDLTTSERLYFTFMPSSFSERKEAQYAQVSILGRSEPILGYSHSTGRVFSITLTFAAHQNPPQIDVLDKVRLIRSWVYPKYGAGAPTVPPRLLLKIGRWLSQRVVLLEYNITYKAPWGYSPVSVAEDSWAETGVDPNLPRMPANMTPDPNWWWNSEGPASYFVPQDSATGGITPVSPTGTGASSFVPFIAEAALVLQETVPNTKSTPYGAEQVRSGEDVGSGWFTDTTLR
jgi:hypothetical protein